MFEFGLTVQILIASLVKKERTITTEEGEPTLKKNSMQILLNFISRKAVKLWQLDAKKAKTISRVASNGEVLLSRKKRWGWPWGKSEEREEREEDLENIRLRLTLFKMFLLLNQEIV